MSDPGYQIVSLDDLDRVRSTDGTLLLRPLRRRLGFRPFGVNAWEGEQRGDLVIEPHREANYGHEELYVVVRGTALFTLEDDTFEATQGTFVHALPGAFRTATALEAGTIVLAVGAKAGEAFAPSGWEDFFVAFALLHGGDEASARAAMEDALAREPDAWQGAYNAACFEALTGDSDAALDQLRRAVALNRDVLEYAADDEDLTSIRDDPRFAEFAR